MLIQFLAKLCNFRATDSVNRKFSTEEGKRICKNIFRDRDIARVPKLSAEQGHPVKESRDPFAKLDRSIADTAKRTRLETKIYRRVRALLRENGLAYGYSEEQALEQATLEVTDAHAK